MTESTGRRGRRIIAIVLLCLVSPLLAVNETDPQKMFERAMKQREQGNYQAAIRAFHGILSINPRLQRARLELAVAYFHALNYRAARKHARAVLEHPATPESVRKRIRRFLAQVAAVAPTHKFKPYIAVGFISDSNATAGPDESVLSGFPTLAVTGGKSDTGIVTWVGMQHSWRPGRKHRGAKANTRPSFYWLSKVNLFRTDYRHVDEQDLDVYTASTGPAFVKPKHWRAVVSAQVDNIRLGGDSYASYFSVYPNFTWIRDRALTEISLGLQLQQRDYKRSVDTGRDSQYLALGLSYGKITRSSKYSWQLGVRLFAEDADANYYSNSGVEYFAGASYRRSTRSILFLRLSTRLADYDGIEPAFTQARDERMDRIVLGYHYKISGGRLKNWEFKSQFTLVRQHSNVSVYQYERNQLELVIEHHF